MDMQLVWLASYPKSGNTWFRVFLSNYLNDGNEGVAINDLEKTPIASAREPFDQRYGISSVDLSAAEIDTRRPAIYDDWKKDPDFLFHKVHDAYTFLPNGKPLMGAPEKQGAIYFIRNPLDVAVSFAHHQGQKDINKTIDNMNNTAFCLNNEKGYSNQFRQQLLTWSEHVQSWKNAFIPTLILRYEDMLQNTADTFKKATDFLRWPHEPERLARAIEHSRFEKLQSQEKKTGFGEKTPNAKNFFRSGKAGDYRHSLTEAQIEKIKQDHAAVMHEFGY